MAIEDAAALAEALSTSPGNVRAALRAYDVARLPRIAACRFVHLCFYLSFCLSICLSLYLSVHLSIYQAIY